MSKATSMEEQILEAAEDLFLERGFDGTSTVAIAKKVGCNQALVHYYFRTKEKLFEKILEREMTQTINLVASMLEGDLPFEERLKMIVNNVFDLLVNHEKVPYFIVNTLVSSEKWRSLAINTYKQCTNQIATFMHFDQIVRDEVAKGTIRNIDTFNLLLDMIGLCLTSFISLPIFEQIAEYQDGFKEEFVKMRKEEVVAVILHGLRPEA